MLEAPTYIALHPPLSEGTHSSLYTQTASPPEIKCFISGGDAVAIRKRERVSRLFAFRLIAFGGAHGLTNESRCRGGLDAYIHVLTDAVALLVEDDDLILLATAKELITRTLTEALNKHLKGLPHVTQVALQRELSLQLNHHIEATNLLFLGDIIR